MPKIVRISGTPRARKRPGRSPESIAAWLAADPWSSTPGHSASFHDLPHMSYSPTQANRAEHARHLNARSRKIVGVGDFHAEAL